MLRLRPESGVQMQLQLNLAWLHRSAFSVGKPGDAGGALLGSFPPKTSSPVQRKLTPFLQTWFLILAEVGMKCSWLLLDGIPSSRVIWKARCPCERALESSVPLQAAKWDCVRLSHGSRILNSACYLGQVGLQPSSERPSCLLLQSALPFKRLPRRMWKRPFSSAASRPFTRVYRTPALRPDSDATLGCFISRRCSFTCRGLVSVCLFTLLSKWVCTGVVTLVESVP